LALFLLICMPLVFSQLSLVPIAEGATAQTAAWTLDYRLSSDTAQPGSQVQFSAVITVVKQVYDFELWVNPGPPLTVDNGHIHIDSLSAGDIRQVAFTITVPTSTQQGDVYVLNFRAQSYSNPAPIWGRIGQNPDTVVDTTTNSQYALQIHIITTPILTIASFGESATTVNVGDTVTLTATITNTGTGTVKDVTATLKLDPTISLQAGQLSHPIGDLTKGQSVTVTWSINASSSGTYSILLYVSASNHQTVTGSQSLTVTVPFWQDQSLVIPLLLVGAFLIIVLIAITRR
jgi:uncharacterized repeat protein (TIGR01451 family)